MTRDTIDLIDTDCQIVHYRYDLPACLRYAYIEKDNHLVEAVRSRLSFEALETFYWRENLLDPDFTREELRLDAEVMDNGHLLMEVHPGLFRHPEMIDLESVWFSIWCRALRQDGVFTLGEIDSILVMAFLKGNLLPRIRGGKLIIIDPALVKRDRPGPGEKKAVATAPKKRGKVRRLNVPPGEVMEFCKENYRRGEWRRIIRGLHKCCLYRERREDKYYPGKSERKNRQYVWGQVWLAKKLGMDRWTLGKWMKRFEADGVIYYPYKGYIGRGASIVELAYTEPHRRMNKRKTGERKNPLSIR